MPAKRGEEGDPGNAQTDAPPAGSSQDDSQDDPGNRITRGGLGGGNTEEQDG